MSQRIIDLRSDTVTFPTERMYLAMSSALLGDDVYGDDPTVNLLEAKAAELLGKEAALFVPTGTMGNLIGVMTHTRPGQEVILEANCHLYIYEVGGLARLAGVQARTIEGSDGLPSAEAIEGAIRGENIHFPETGLICLENTHNVAGGMVLPLDQMKTIHDLARRKGIPVHLDGARIFNAALYLGVEPKEIAQYADSVMFCLSKGLSAPVGSLLVGTKAYIDRARKNRKMLGGGMRQAGILAAAGLTALENHQSWLKKDHDNAELLASELNQLDGVRVKLENVHTNIVNADFSPSQLSTAAIVESLTAKGVLSNRSNHRIIRFVTHRGIEKEDILEAVQVIQETLKELGE